MDSIPGMRNRRNRVRIPAIPKIVGHISEKIIIAKKLLMLYLIANKHNWIDRVFIYKTLCIYILTIIGNTFTRDSSFHGLIVLRIWLCTYRLRPIIVLTAKKNYPAAVVTSIVWTLKSFSKYGLKLTSVIFPEGTDSFDRTLFYVRHNFARLF